MNIKLKIFLAGAIFLMSSVAFAASFDASEWHSKSQVYIDKVSKDGLARILIGRPLVAYTGLLPNIRILMGGAEVPFAPDNAFSAVQSPKYAAVSDAWGDGTMRGAIADLGSEGLVHDNLTLGFGPSGSYKKQVSIYVSSVKYPAEDARWRLVADQGYIWSYRDDKAGFIASNTTVTYPRQTSRYVKVVVFGGEGRADGIQSAAFSGDFADRTMREESFDSPLSIEEDSQKNETVITADFGKVERVNSVRLKSKDSNFNRRVSVEYYTEGGERRIAPAGYIFSVDTSLFTHSELTIPLGEIVAKRIELRVINENDKPLSFSNEATFVSPIASVIAKPNRTGEADIYLEGRSSYPRYDLASIVNYADSDIPESKASGFQSNEEYIAPMAPPVPLSENSAILIPLVVLAVAILGGFIFSYYRKLKEKPDDGSPTIQ